LVFKIKLNYLITIIIETRYIQQLWGFVGAVIDRTDDHSERPAANTQRNFNYGKPTFSMRLPIFGVVYSQLSITTG